MSEQYRLVMSSITKRFGGITALDNVDFYVKPGEIHALVGENGAGKSTLVKILAGANILDSGSIFIDGEGANIKNPKDGIDRGISVIYQEFALMPDVTVAENIFIDDINASKGILVRRKKLYADTQEILDRLGFGMISPRTLVKDLPIAHCQVVEICKALSRNCRILVLDEPTSVLSTYETEQLFVLLKMLRDRGVSVVYISHRLGEIFSISDRISVLRDGHNVDTVDANDVTEQEIVSLMIGRDLGSYYPIREHNIGDVVFEARNIVSGKAVKDVSFNVRAGEVFGLTGLIGAGRTETLMAILGERKSESGKVYIGGKEVKIRSPIDALKSGVSLLPEDRKTQGVFLDLPILHNMTVSCMDRVSSKIGIVQFKKERALGNSLVDKLRIKIGALSNPCSSLSGGNQQKVSISKLLNTESKILFFDEPTRGVDVGAKVEIYKIINEIVAEGYGVVMISSEMPEVIGMCDRVAVMRNGRITGELDREELTEVNLIKYSMEVD